MFWCTSLPLIGRKELYKLPHELLFATLAIFAIVTGCSSYRGVVTFIAVHRWRRLNVSFGLNWRRTPAHTAVRYILQELDPTAAEGALRRPAARGASHAGTGQHRP
jgi:hypothetical protein